MNISIGGVIEIQTQKKLPVAVALKFTVHVCIIMCSIILEETQKICSVKHSGDNL